MNCSHKVCTKDKGCICLIDLKKAKCNLCMNKSPMSLQDATDIIISGGYLYVDDEGLRVVRTLTEKLNESDKLPFNEWFTKNAL